MQEMGPYYDDRLFELAIEATRAGTKEKLVIWAKQIELIKRYSELN